MTKLGGTFLGLLLVAYGVNQEWLNRVGYDSQAKQKFCRAWLCPQEFWDARTFQLQQQSAGGASAKVLPQFQRALLADSASAYHWADLAEANRDAGNFDRATYAFRRSLAAGPGNPSIVFRAANYAFENGDADTVLERLTGVLRNTELTAYYQPVFLTYSRLGLPMEHILERGIPPLASAAEPFLQYWLNANKVPEAEATWRWMAAHSLISEQSCGNFTNFLIRNGMLEQAVTEWQRVYKAGGSNYRNVNWIYNGGFEAEPKPGPLDWRVSSSADVEVARVEDVSRDGQWCLRLAFNGKQNVGFHDVYQETLLSPGRWQLAAFIKFENLTADRGISLHLYDAQSPARLDVRTTAKPGLIEWTEVNQTFDVGGETKLVRLEVELAPSPKAENGRGGRAWVDSISLAPAR